MAIKAHSKQQLQLIANHKITLDQLHGAITNAVKVGGCPPCGLLGWDVHILGGDPVTESFRSEGIEAVIVNTAQGHV